MSDQTPRFFGIDLGTTNSVISYIDQDGRPTVVRCDASSSYTLPSIVYFEKLNNIIVGSAAKNVAVVYPDRVVRRVKRFMGTSREWTFDGEQWTAEKISSLILKRLAADAAEETGQEVRQVVITVPAYFGMLERDATINAGRIAGLDVIGIVPEPVAAALQYDLPTDQGERTILVYDLGGGTFDTSVIRITADSIEVLCTDGDQELGGVDWDQRLVEHLVSSFVEETDPGEDPREDEAFMQALYNDAEALKQQLSQQDSRTLAIRHAGAVAMIEVTREKFEEITSDLLDRTMDCTERALKALSDKLGVADPAQQIDDVLLVGGSSRMPAVKTRLVEKYGWAPKLHDPDLAVARGAARFSVSRGVWGGIDLTAGAPSEADTRDQIKRIALQTGMSEDALAAMAAKRIVSVLPKAFGIKVVDGSHPLSSTDPEAASYIAHLVHANDQLPSELQVINAGTVIDGQTEIEVEIYEQGGSVESRELPDNKPLIDGVGRITGLPYLPKSSPIDLSMQVDADGQLCVTALEPTSGKKLEINVRISMMTEEQVVVARQAVAQISVRD